MKVLVIGKGAREHALCWRLHSSQSVWGLFCAPGNPGIDQLAKPVAIAQNDFPGLIAFAKENKIDLTIVGPDDPIAAGIVDEFEKGGLRIFGPSKAAAQLESSKAFAKRVMREAVVSTADFQVFDDPQAAREYAKSLGGNVVVKADGLALGKGVVVCRDLESANAAIADAMEARKFGASGARVVLEDVLHGEELSFFALCNGDDAIPLGLFQDHKAIFDGDRGPNTGGMGAYSPVPQIPAALEDRLLDEVVRPVLRVMKSKGMPFRGVLFVGLMINGERIDVIEFNVRFGDPECQPMMMRFDGDLAETLLACAEGNLAKAAPRLSPKSAVSVVLASGGYPGNYRKGIPIFGLEKIEGSAPSDLKVKWAMEKTRVKVFHAGTAMRDGQLVTDGGRVLAVTASSDTLPKAVAAAYQAADMIEFEGKHLRRDIGARALAYLAENR
ncbi:MAG TPA: phosphoribosylamine--glycine ligase [Candidatus Binataceae bacterium]|nr:phosphoribosylamine--glycine ligase [Candidatus Binataceae bacterium]